MARSLKLEMLPSNSAQDLYRMFAHWGRDEWMRSRFDPRQFDPTLPVGDDFKRFADDPALLPAEFRPFDLVFPRVVYEGMFEGGGADRVTDDSIGVLVWDGKAWQKSCVLAGLQGWGYDGPHHFGPRARLVRFVD